MSRSQSLLFHPGVSNMNSDAGELETPRASPPRLTEAQKEEAERSIDAVSTETMNTTSESQFDPSKHCRYCFCIMISDNCSSCLCTGLLCRNCLQKELTISWNRNLNTLNNSNIAQPANPKLNCTVCKYQYHVTRTKLAMEKSVFAFLKYFFQKSFPKQGKRDLSIFQNWNNETYILPQATGNMIVFIIVNWCLFCLLIEGIGGYRLTDGRVIIFLFDVYLLVEVLRITSFIDFPERIWLFAVYFIRSIIFAVWAIVAFIKERTLISYEEPRYNWVWLGIQVLIAWISLMYELKKYLHDLKRRALRDNLQKINVAIRSTKGKKYEFMLPKSPQNPPAANFIL